MPVQRRGRGLNSPDSPSRGGGRGKFIPYIYLKNDLDRVKFRCLSEVTEEQADAVGTPSVVLVGDFHRVPRRSNRGKEWHQEVMCSVEADENGVYSGDCPHCNEDIDRRTRFMAWVYVYAIYHVGQNPAYNPGDPKTAELKWTLVKLGASGQAYREVIEDFMVWQDGFYMKEQLKAVADMNGTITDRDMMVTRHGAPKSTQVQRQLRELDESALNPEWLEKVADLPDLYDIAIGEVDTLDGAPVNAQHEEVGMEEDEAVEDDLTPKVKPAVAKAATDSVKPKAGASKADALKAKKAAAAAAAKATESEAEFGEEEALFDDEALFDQEPPLGEDSLEDLPF